MRASSWASTTTRRARSVNRSNMRISSKAPVGSFGTTPQPAYAFPPRTHPASAISEQGWGGASVRGFEGLADRGRDAAALGDLVAVGAGPVADLLRAVRAAG